MYWHCEICDNIMNVELKNKHLESNFHSSLVNSIIPNPNSNKIDDIIRIYFLIHNKNYHKFQVVLSLKLLRPSNQIKHIRIQH